MPTIVLDDVSLANTGVVIEEKIIVISDSPMGPPGEKGEKGDATVVGASTDAGNALTAGGDGGLYVSDDVPVDPLAYYILSRS